MLGRFQSAVLKSSIWFRICFPYEIENIWDGSCHLSFIDLCDKKYYAAKTEQQQWWILQITGMSCPRHRLSLVAKSRQCLQLFSSSSPRIFVCGSNPMWRRDIYLPGGWICECPFTAHCGCKCVHWAVPVPSIVTFASHITSSCRLFRLWYLTCCEQNPVLRLVVYLWCELSSITGQACRQFFTKCNVYLQKGSKLPFFKYHRFVRPPDFLALVAISCPKSLRGLVGDWAGSVHGVHGPRSLDARAASTNLPARWSNVNKQQHIWRESIWNYQLQIVCSPHFIMSIL